MNKIKKWLLKALMPSAQDIASFATSTVVEFINTSGKEDVISKYGTMADNFTKVQSNITGWLKDGKMDDEEKLQLYHALLPLANKIVNIINERIEEESK